MIRVAIVLLAAVALCALVRCRRCPDLTAHQPERTCPPETGVNDPVLDDLEALVEEYRNVWCSYYERSTDATR